MYRQDDVIKSLINGQFSQAKSQVTKGCKSKPEVLAYRVGRIVGALTDSADSYRRPDLAVRFLNMFK